MSISKFCLCPRDYENDETIHHADCPYASSGAAKAAAAKMPTADEVARSLELALAREAAIVAAPYVNRARIDFCEGNMLKFTFAEQSPQVATVMARTSVLMSPETASALADLINKYMQKVEISWRKQ